MHYNRWHQHGDPLKTVKAANGARTRYFESVVLTYDGDDCLDWPYGNSGGYGTVRYNGKAQLVSRLVCERQNGPPPTPKHQAAHSCGRGHLGCVAKTHLSWKTNTENQADRYLHGTHQLGQNNPGAKLSEDDVRRIRALRGTARQRDIAAEFAVSRELISAIHRGRAWVWLA